MGMFDRVWLDCPKCFAKVEAQSKGGDCTLADYDAIDAPSNVLWDLFGDSMVDRAMKYYDENAGNKGCHLRIAKQFGILNREAKELIHIGLWRRNNNWKRKS
jgi:hypothetical protein